jgi:hypothetical protein
MARVRQNTDVESGIVRETFGVYVKEIVLNMELSEKEKPKVDRV